MKKIITFLIIITLCFGFSGNLLPNDFGIKAGVKFPMETGITERPHDACPIFGIFYSLDLSDRMALQTEVLYYREVITDYQNIGIVKKDYLEIPIFFKFKNRSYNRLKPELFIGLVYVIQLREEWGGKSGNYDMERYSGITGGISFDIDMKYGAFVFDARANVPLFKTWADEFFMGFKPGFALTAGCRFGRH